MPRSSMIRNAARWGRHPIVAEIRRAVADYARDRHQARRAEPCVWALFHRRMAETLPAWRVIARAWHRAASRRYAAMAVADCPSAAKHLGV